MCKEQDTENVDFAANFYSKKRIMRKKKPTNAQQRMSVLVEPEMLEPEHLASM